MQLAEPIKPTRKRVISRDVDAQRWQLPVVQGPLVNRSDDAFPTHPPTAGQMQSLHRDAYRDITLFRVGFMGSASCMSYGVAD